ncbi:MAG: hypothetical protein BMS9Abin34_538 [Patescibacteria group bacterium]|nr:MAG: hypothetical protein BMS9Abin34_538 [Patescibacteria group bacterium]
MKRLSATDLQSPVKPHRGFTLIELLVVISIIGLLATLGIGQYRRSQALSRDARRQSDLSSFRNALEIYYADNGSYLTTGDVWVDVSSALSSLVPTYIKELHSDPGGAGQTYRYRAFDSQQVYCLEAFLEAQSGTQNSCRRADGSAITIEAAYNYGVGNP